MFVGWLFVTKADKTSISILKDSFWALLLLPALLAILFGAALTMADLAIGALLNPTASYVLGIIALVLFEEAIKVRASQIRKSRIQSFALVSLFGIFELALFKPFFMLKVSAPGTEAIWLQLSLLPAVAMHVLTAALYAFHFRQSLLAQFTVCCAIHLAFNLAADAEDLISNPVWLFSVVPLVAATYWLIPQRADPARGDWLMDQPAKKSSV